MELSQLISTLRSRKLFYGMVEWSVLLAAGLFGLCFFYVVYHSVGFPFGLGWMEGHSVDVVQRVLDGKPFYTKPSLEYVPFIYTPYYYYVTAFVSLFTGVDLLPARLVAIAATLGCCFIAFLWVRREGGNWKIALTTAFLFLATYRMGGRWFDMARVDMLFLFLTVAGLYVAVFYRGIPNAVLAAVILAFAFFTKQTALMIAAPVLLSLLLTDIKHALWVGITLLLLVIVSCLAMHVYSDGWSTFFIFTVPSAHNVEKRMYLEFWEIDVFSRLGMFLIAGMAGVGYICFRNWRKGMVYLAMTLAFVGGSYASRLHTGGWINVLIPMHFFLVLVMGITVAKARDMKHSDVLFPLAAAVVLVELATMIYDPRLLVPTPNSEAKGNRFLEKVASMEGDAYIPHIQFVSTRVGQKSYMQGMAFMDILRANLGEKEYIKQDLVKEIEDAVIDQRFDAIVTAWWFWVPNLQIFYYEDEKLPSLEYVTGAFRTVPVVIFRPKQISSIKRDDK